MNPHFTAAIAEQRIADLRSAAEASRRARAAADARSARKSRLSWLLASRRYREVELVWPDGVCTVVSAPRASAPAGDQDQHLSGARR